MQQELPPNVIWLEDGDNSRYVRQYEFKPFSIGDVGTFYDFHADGTLDYDSALTCRVEEDLVYGEVARAV